MAFEALANKAAVCFLTLAVECGARRFVPDRTCHHSVVHAEWLLHDGSSRPEERGLVVRRGLLVALMIVASAGAAIVSYLYWDAYRLRQDQALEATMVERYRNSGPIAESLPGVALDLSRAVRTVVARSRRDPAFAVALKHLKAGAPKEAEASLRSAVQVEASGNRATDGRERLEAHFALGTIAALSDPERARDSFAKAVELDETDRDSQFWHGWLELVGGNQSGAERAYRRVLGGRTGNAGSARAKDVSVDGIEFWCRVGIGDVESGRRRNEAAREQFEKARALAQRLVSGEPSNSVFQRMWAIASDRLGGALLAAGKPAEALGPIRDSLTVATQLSEKEPLNKGRLRELAMAHSRLGDLLVGTGKTEQALGVFASGIAIARRLAEGENAQPLWRRDLAVALIKAGDAERHLGKPDEALKHYEDAHDVIVQAVASAPAMRGWQEDVGVTNERIGDAHLQRGDAEAALASYQAKFNVARDLAAATPGEEKHQRDLALAHQKIASALQAQGKTDAALKSLGEAKTLLGRLSSARELAQVNAQIGDILNARGLAAAALAVFKDADAAFSQLLAKQPGRLDLQRDAASVRDRIGDLSMQIGKLDDAMSALQSSLVARESLAKLEPENGRAAREVAVTLGKIGDVLVYQQKPAEALPKFLAQLAMSTRLAEAEPGNAIWKHDVAIAWERIGRANYMTGDQAAARVGFERSLRIYDDLLRADSDNAHFLSGIAIPLVSLGSLDAERRQAYYVRAYRILRGLADAGRLEPRRRSLLADLERNLAQ